MTRFMTKLMALAVVLSVSLIGTSYADDGSVAALKGEVSDLSSKVAALERQIGRMSSGSSAAYIPDGDGAGGLLKAAQDINMGGHVDVQYNMNFDQPHTDSVSNPTSALRIYDGNDGSFTVNAAELYFEKPAEEIGEAGFRIDVTFGQDAAVTSADGDGDVVDLQQAYVEYIAGLSIFEDSEVLPDSIKLTAGRFATLAGYEVIEGPDNWNISRSVAYGFSIPFTHTGLRTNFSMFDGYFDVYLGINNGWDLPVDNNGGKTFESAVGFSPIEGLDLFHTFYWGGEKDGTTTGRRWLFTNTATYAVTDKLTAATEFNVGAEHNNPDATRLAVTPNVTRTNSETDTSWYSVNTYINYQLNKKLSATARYEIFRDPQLYRTGTADSIFGQTYTVEYKLAENMITRAEFRHDKADNDEIFGDDTSRTSLGAQVIYLI